jgi:hypothetical protein
MSEFDDVIRLLQDERPRATELELDSIKQRVRRRAADHSRRNQSMKSRLAILGMLVTGLLFSMAGAGLAVSGITQSGTNAAISQYATPTPTPTPTVTPTATPEGGVLPAEDENAPEEEEGGGGVLPAEEETQPERQQAVATESELPFTGFAAIPILVGGIALLTGGLILRSRTRSEH